MVITETAVNDLMTVEILTDSHEKWLQRMIAKGEKADDHLTRARHHLSYAVHGHLEDLDRYVVYLGEYLLADTAADPISVDQHLNNATDALLTWGNQNFARKLMRHALLRKANGIVPVGKGSLKLLLRTLWPW